MENEKQGLTPEQYEKIIAALSSQKAQAEIAALEWRVRYESAVQVPVD